MKFFFHHKVLENKTSKNSQISGLLSPKFDFFFKFPET